MSGGVGNFDPSPGLGLQSDGAIVRVVEMPANADPATFHMTRASYERARRLSPKCQHRYSRYRAPRWYRVAGRWHRWTCLACGLEIRVGKR